MENNSLRPIIQINKNTIDNRSARYTLYVSERESEKIYSISVCIEDDTAFAEDITRGRKRAEEFLYLIAGEELEPCHLLDVLYDTLPI